MKGLILVFGLVAVALTGCTIRQSFYKRHELPKDLDEATQREIAMAVFRAMQSQPFVDQVKQKFPAVTREQLLKTDLRWDVFVTSQSRSFFLSFGVKDTRDFPQAEAVVDFFLAFGQQEADLLVKQAYAQGKKKA